MAPDFSERTANLVNKYSYTLPKKSTTGKKGVSQSKRLDGGTHHIRSLRNDLSMPDYAIAGKSNISTTKSPFIAQIKDE